MLYNIRFQIQGEEHSMAVTAETAAMAVEEVRRQAGITDDGFELIQISLVDDEPAQEAVLASG